MDPLNSYTEDNTLTGHEGNQNGGFRYFPAIPEDDGAFSRTPTLQWSLDTGHSPEGSPRVVHSACSHVHGSYGFVDLNVMNTQKFLESLEKLLRR